MIIKYKVNGKKKQVTKNASISVDKLSACLGILWNEGLRGWNLDPHWLKMERTGHVTINGKKYELVSFESSEREKKGFFGETEDPPNAKREIEYLSQLARKKQERGILGL